MEALFKHKQCVCLTSSQKPTKKGKSRRCELNFTFMTSSRHMEWRKGMDVKSELNTLMLVTVEFLS